jgi:hypothetical protein
MKTQGEMIDSMMAILDSTNNLIEGLQISQRALISQVKILTKSLICIQDEVKLLRLEQARNKTESN